MKVSNIALFSGLSGALVLAMNASYIVSSSYHDQAGAHRDPVTSSTPAQESHIKKVYYGIASWYGRQFHGKTMANGETFDKNKATVAHRDFWKFPRGTYAKVTNLANNRTIIIPITDRGPFTEEDGRYTRDLDLSEEAARRLDPFYKEKGLLPVRYEFI